jgi:hypothetical protein
MPAPNTVNKINRFPAARDDLSLETGGCHACPAGWLPAEAGQALHIAGPLAFI